VEHEHLSLRVLQLLRADLTLRAPYAWRLVECRSFTPGTVLDDGGQC
jgi:hypothetical protein